MFYSGLTNSATEQVLYEQQMKLPGAMISFELKCGYVGGIKLLNNLKLIIGLLPTCTCGGNNETEWVQQCFSNWIAMSCIYSKFERKQMY